jgi:hypothetical protein
LNSTSTLFFGLILITIGFLIGVLVFYRRARPTHETLEEKQFNRFHRGEARIWRDALSQRLVIQMEGKIFRSPDEMSVEQRLRLAHLVGEASAWGPRQAIPPKGIAAELRPTDVQAVIAPVPVAGGKTLKVSAPRSIAAQIDEILQAKLAGTHLTGRGIKLAELPDHGLVVIVGLEKYTDLTLIPDEEVRALIGEAVAEWEDQASKP